MAAVLTTSMSLRIILSVRGTLVAGGSFAGSAQSGSRTTHIISTRSGAPTNISSQSPHTYTLDDMRSKAEGEWPDADGKSSIKEAKGEVLPINPTAGGDLGVKVTVNREVEYDNAPYLHKHVWIPCGVLIREMRKDG